MKKATNSASMRLKNEKIILSLINRQPVSRAELAKKTGLTKAAITFIIDDLKNRKIICESVEKTSSVGRNPVMLFINKKAFYVIGINISRVDITVGLADLGGEPVCECAFEICSPQKAVLKIKKAVEDMLLHCGINKDRIYKISVATPGPVDRKNGVILNPPNFKEWHNFAVKKELKAATGFDVVLENVSSTMALAEKYFGAAKNSESFLALQVDEGIGSGIMFGDSLFKGPCEIGHISIKYNGIKCECGNCGCLEKYASIPRILSGSEFKSWKEAVDNNAEEIIKKEAEYLSTAIISANNIFDFDKIVLCGDLVYKPQKITKLVFERVSKNIISKKSFEVCAGKVASKLVTASSAAINDFFV